MQKNLLTIDILDGWCLIAGSCCRTLFTWHIICVAIRKDPLIIQLPEILFPGLWWHVPYPQGGRGAGQSGQLHSWGNCTVSSRHSRGRILVLSGRSSSAQSKNATLTLSHRRIAPRTLWDFVSCPRARSRPFRVEVDLHAASFRRGSFNFPDS